MSDDLIGRGVVEVVGNTDDVTAKIAKVGDDLEKMARRASKSGKDASDGIKQIGEGLKQSSDGASDATKKFEADLKKLIATTGGAKRGTTEYLREQAKLKGADSKVLEPLFRQYESVRRGAAAAAAETRKFAESQRFLRGLESQANSIGKTASQLAALKAEQLGVAKEAAPMIAKMQAAERAANSTGGAFSRLSGYVKATVAAFGIREIVRYADSWTELQNRLRLVTGSQSKLAAATDDVYRIAKTTNQELAATGEVYQRFAQNAETLGISQAKVAEVTETVSKAVAVSGASAQAAQAALTQFGQALASGVLRGEEFNSVMEQTPGLAQAIARGMGVAVGELRALAADGKITADVLIEALTNAKDSVDEQFNTRVVTLSQSFTNLRTSVARYIGELNTSTGITSTFGRAVEALADNLDVAATAATTLIALKVSQWMGLASVATLSFTGSVKAATVAVRGFFAAIGPIGWAILAVGSLVAAWQKFGDQIEGSKQIARTFGATWDSVTSVIGDGFRSVSESASKFFGFVSDKPREAARDMGQAFEDGVIAVAGALDSLHSGVSGTMAAVGSVFLTVAENMETVFKNAFNRVREMASELAHNLATQLGKLTGINIETSLYVGPGNVKTKDVMAEARKAYEANAKGFGLADSIKNNIEASAWATLYEGMADSAGKAGQAVKALGEETDKTKKKVSDAQKAAEAFAKQRESDIRSQYQQISALHEQAQALEDQVATFGMGKAAIDELTIARLEEQAAILQGFAGSDEQVELIEREIEARKRLRAAIGSLEQREAEQAAWDAWVQDMDRVFQQVGQSLTDQIFEGGRSARDMIRDLFKGLVLRVAIQPIMDSIQGMVTNQLGGMLGLQNPGGNVLGMAQNASSLYGAVSGGLTGNVSKAIGWVGEKIGSTALQKFAAGLAGSAAAGGAAAGGAAAGGAAAGGAAAGGAAAGGSAAGGAAAGGAAAGGSAAGGAAGLGATLGAALPWVGGALAVGSMFGLFGKRPPKTRHGQRSRVDFAGDTFDITSIDDRQPGAESSVQQLVKQAVQSANAVFQQVGIDAAIDTFYAMTESSVLGDRQGVASGGLLRIGDALRQIGIRESSDMTFAGFGGWSEADMLPRLQTDIQLSILQAFQAVGDQLPRVLADMVAGVDIRGLGAEQAQALAQSFQLVIDQVSAFQVAVESLPFANLRDLSFDAAANLIHFAGGLENLDAGMTNYFQNFYSEQEQLEWAAQQIGTAFTGLGLTMPDVYQGADAAKRQFRELVESLDLNTEAGQQAYATLMTLSGGFAELVTGMESLNASVDTLSAATARFQGAAQAAQRAMQMVTSGGALADRIGGMLGLDPVFAMRREQELWATIGTASYEQQTEMAGELTDIVLNRINAEQQANQQRLATIREELTNYRRMRDIGASLQTYLGSLESSNLAPYSLAEKVSNAEAELNKLVSAARRGDENAMRQVQGALQNALSLWREYGASGEEYQSAYHRLTGMVGNLANAAVSDAARQIAQLEAQSAALESMSGISAESLAQLQQLYDITTAATEAAYSQYQSELANANTELAQLERMGLDTARLHEIADLLKDMPALIGAQLAGASAAREQQYYQDKLAQLQATGSTAGGIDWMGASTSDLAAYFESVGLTPGQHYNEYGKYEGLSYGGSTRDQRYYEAKLAQLQAANSMDGGIDWRGATTSDLAAFFRSLGLTPEEHYQRYGKYEGLSYAVGTSYVPRDMTANIHKGEIIIDPRSSDILRRYGIGVQSSGGDAAEMQALRQEVARLTQVVEQTGQAQVTATHQAAERSADKITAGVGQAVTRRDRDDLNARNMKRVGVLA